MPALFLTGSSGALASAIRTHFLANGWTVAGFDRQADDCRDPEFRFYEINGMEEDSVSKAFDRASEELGAPRSLVATVGGIKPWRPITEVSLEDFKFLIDLNLVTFFLAARNAMSLMTPRRSGSIISIGAEPAIHPAPNKSGYVAAKAGVIALTEVIAQEGKEFGINANVIIPTTIHTKANEEWGSPEEIAKWTAPEDIAAMCYFLSTDPGKAVNGAKIEMPNRV